MADMTVRQVCGRDAALLRAVCDARCELEPGWWPVLYVDGRACCDPAAAHRLVEAGLLAAPKPGMAAGEAGGVGTTQPGAGRVPARLTDAGRAVLEHG